MVPEISLTITSQQRFDHESLLRGNTYFGGTVAQGAKQTRGIE